MPIVEGLIDYINEDIIPFHMPGHKNNKRQFNELNVIRDNLYKMDNTEVPGLDNLHLPEEMILHSQKLAAQAYKAAKSYFLINGSTCGIYSMITGTTKPGDKIIVQRNCHRSVFMACFLGGLNCVYVNPRILDEFNIAVSVETSDLIKIMDENPDAKAIVITNPTFYGTCCNLEEIVKEAHRRKILVLVDEAHGAHFPFNDNLPKSAMECGADVSVVSMHKTTPALTQTALLNVSKGVDTEGIEFMLKLYQSTSPSYILLASIDTARYIMQEKGRILTDELLVNINEFRDKMSSIEEYRLLGKEHIGVKGVSDVDITKIVISSNFGGKNLDNLLRQKYGIQVEMSDVNNITLICSVGDNKESFDLLYNALIDVIKNKEKVNKSIHFKKSIPGYKIAINMREAYYTKKRRIRLCEASGMISGELVAPYPPGIPVLLPGEYITDEIINYIEFVKENNIPLNGINDGTAEYINVLDV
ncbi:aminotransferase class I/II-fold pyridoxal phosphate-dependent enzyme [Fervidicella metallireducens]|nr:aminotransferase class V-fold PLP-dependent enzyme [Fervidicella metallireducens]